LPRGTSRCDCEAAAKSGRHVFCEKPLCTAAEDAERAIAAIKKASVQLGIGHERRFEPAVIELRKRFADGEFGNALVLEGNFSQDKFLNLPPDNWRLSNTINPVGPLSATGIHLVDLSIAILGKPTQVWVRLATLGSNFANGDTLSITIGFGSGADRHAERRPCHALYGPSRAAGIERLDGNSRPDPSRKLDGLGRDARSPRSFAGNCLLSAASGRARQPGIIRPGCTRQGFISRHA
jgi:predicted dehydrogenase